MTEVIGTNYYIIPYRKVTNIFIVSNILKSYTTGWECEKSIINNIKAFTIYLFFRTFPRHRHKKKDSAQLFWVARYLNHIYVTEVSHVFSLFHYGMVQETLFLSLFHTEWCREHCFFQYSIRNGAGNVVSFSIPYGMVQETLFLSLFHTEWCRKRCF